MLPNDDPQQRETSTVDVSIKEGKKNQWGAKNTKKDAAAATKDAPTAKAPRNKVTDAELKILDKRSWVEMAEDDEAMMDQAAEKVPAQAEDQAMVVPAPAEDQEMVYPATVQASASRAKGKGRSKK